MFFFFFGGGGADLGLQEFASFGLRVFKAQGLGIGFRVLGALGPLNFRD